jgi:hypothetical protein
VDNLVTIVGWILFIGAAITLVLHLVIDVLGAIKKLRNTNNNRATVEALGLPDLLEKLPERYFAATIVMLVGLALAAPATFGNVWTQAFTGGS